MEQHHYLAQHPEIAMPKIKGQDILNKAKATIEDYLDLYEVTQNHKIKGEVSSVYYASELACSKIKEFFPNARLIFVLRNPSDRAFTVLKSAGFADKEIFEHLEKAQNTKIGKILKGGLYSNNIRMYFEEFSRENIKIFTFDDYIKDQKTFFNDFFDFVSVDTKFLPDTSVIFRKGGNSVNPSLEKAIISNQLLRSVLKFFVSPFTTPEQRRLLTIKFRNSLRRKPEFSPELKNKLIKFYENDILKTQDLISRDLSHWLR